MPLQKYANKKMNYNKNYLKWLEIRAIIFLSLGNNNNI